MYELSHWLHWYGFSGMCSIMWCSKPLLLVNVLSHRLHWNGFSLVWSTVLVLKAQVFLKPHCHYASSYDLWKWNNKDFLSHLLVKSGSSRLCIIIFSLSMKLTGKVYYIYCIAITHVWSRFLDKLSITYLLGNIFMNCLLALIITLCLMVNF